MHKHVKLVIPKKNIKSSGMSRYSETLLEYLGPNISPVEIDFKIPFLLKHFFNRFHINLESTLNHIPPYINFDNSPDYIWHFTNQLQTIALNFKKPLHCIVTVLDIIPIISNFKEPSFFMQHLFKLAVRNIKTADALIAISEWTKKDLVDHFNINPDKIIVIPLAVDKKFRPLNTPKNSGEIRILYVGSERTRKNLNILLEAFSILIKKDKTIKLIKAGLPQSFASRKKFIQNAKQNKVYGNIHILNYVDDIVREYNKADVFVFPSKYEGFGLPVLEAMACGCPVVCSNATALPEVGGESVLYFDPDKPEELAASIDRILHDTELRNTLIKSGLKRSKNFSWEKVALKTKEVYSRF